MMGNYDSWKLRSDLDDMPDDDPPREPTDDTDEDLDGRLDKAFAKLSATARTLKADHDRFEAALRKIERWQKYRFFSEGSSEYETGANDAIDTLAKIARDALDSAAEPKF